MNNTQKRMDNALQNITPKSKCIMHCLTAADLEMIGKVVCELKSSACALDSIPATF